MAELAPGAVVALRGLKARPELNGARAAVVRYARAKERYVVRVPRLPKPMLFRRANLQPVVEEPASGVLLRVAALPEELWKGGSIFQYL